MTKDSEEAVVIIKTDYRLPESTLEKLSDLCSTMGVSKNQFVVLALTEKLAQFASLIKLKKKRQILLDDVEKLFKKTITEARRLQL